MTDRYLKEILLIKTKLQILIEESQNIKKKTDVINKFLVSSIKGLNDIVADIQGSTKQ